MSGSLLSEVCGDGATLGLLRMRARTAVSELGISRGRVSEVGRKL